jgi:hypothetical protein
LVAAVRPRYEEAIRNANCPPKALLEATQRYLAHFKDSDEDEDEFEYTIENIAANPALPPEARKLLIDHLKQKEDDEVCEGLCRNSVLTETERRDLATNAAAPDNRQIFEHAVWIWCGGTISK